VNEQAMVECADHPPRAMACRCDQSTTVTMEAWSDGDSEVRLKLVTTLAKREPRHESAHLNRHSGAAQRTLRQSSPALRSESVGRREAWRSER
jgi:hypothetical protein